MSINRVTITGCLGANAELRATPTGSGILSFRVAVNERKKNQSAGEWEEIPNWVPCVIFGPRAEKLAQYLTKGTKVAIEGRLRYSSWEKDGQKRSKLEVVVDEVEFMSRAQQPQQAAPYQAPTPELRNAQSAIQAAFPGAQPVPPEGELYDANIPF